MTLLNLIIIIHDHHYTENILDTRILITEIFNLNKKIELMCPYNFQINFKNRIIAIQR